MFPVTGGVRWAVLGDLAEVEDGGSIVVPEVARAPAGNVGYRRARAVLRAAAA
jgi:hypothetical protein